MSFHATCDRRWGLKMLTSGYLRLWSEWSGYRKRMDARRNNHLGQSCLHMSCVWQVQNVSQSMEVVDLRTSRDLQYVRDTEPLLRGVDGRLHTYVANPRALTAKGLQVPTLTHTSTHLHANIPRVQNLTHRHIHTQYYRRCGEHITFGVKTLISRMPSWSLWAALRHTCIFHQGDKICLEAVDFPCFREEVSDYCCESASLAASLHTYELRKTREN